MSVCNNEMNVINANAYGFAKYDELGNINVKQYMKVSQCLYRVMIILCICQIRIYKPLYMPYSNVLYENDKRAF